MKTYSIDSLVVKFFLDDKTFNDIPEYLKVVEKINSILVTGKPRSLKYILDKVTLLGFEALIILVKLDKSCLELISELIYEEEFELCSLVRDINETIKNYLYDFEE